MESTHSKHFLLNAIALLITLPAAWFLLINILNETGISGPYTASQPILESLGINESLGWNINLLIFLGPIIGIFLSAVQVIKIKWKFSKEVFHFFFSVHKRWFPILVAAFSCALLTIFFFYLLGENCKC